MGEDGELEGERVGIREHIKFSLSKTSLFNPVPHTQSKMSKQMPTYLSTAIIN